jgi:hypothetical protein
MGCGAANLKLKKGPKTFQEKELERNKTKSVYLKRKLTKELEEIQHKNINVEEKNYIKLAKEAKELEEICWKHLSLEKQTFFDLLNQLEENNNLNTFHIENVVIDSAADKMILLARVLMKKCNLKILKFISLNNLGRKVGKSIAKIMEGCKLIEKLVLKDLDIQEDESKFIAYILENLSENLIYFEMSLIFFSSKKDVFLSGIEKNIKLREVVLQKISLSEDDFTFLVNALSNNEGLKRLDVSDNTVRSGTSVFKFVTLSNLETLQMNNCSIDDESFINLLEGIERYTSISILELNRNLITKVSCKNLAEYFHKNITLKNLYILHNKLCKRDLDSMLSNDNLVKLISEI